MSIRVVIFDLDDTLVDFSKCEKKGLETIFNHYHLKLTKEMEKTFSKIDQRLWNTLKWDEKDLEKHEIPEERFRILFNLFNIKQMDYYLANQLFMDGFSKAIYPLEYAHEVIEYLYHKGMILYIATNGLKKLQNPRILNTTFGKYIHKIITSEEILVSKPNPKIFQTIIEETNASLDEVITIGDSLKHDIKGAINANIKSVWFNSKGKENNTKITPTYEIKNLLELKEIL